MSDLDKKSLRSASPYNAAITREQFLFYETRTTAQLLSAGLSRDEAVEHIVKENLFQYPTEKSVRRMALACLRRLDALEDAALVRALAELPGSAAKQIDLYAMMRQYRLVRDFMLSVIGTKYRTLDVSFGRADLQGFFLRLQEQDGWVAAWSEGTITRLKQELQRILVENEYLDGINSKRLNPVLIDPLLEKAIRAAGQQILLPAFNCLD